MDQGRYIRQTTLTEFGVKGQEELSKASAVIIGCGGLGSIVGPYLAGAGVGKIKLVDGDKPQLSNLHRQVFYTTNNYNESKAILLKRHLEKLNPETDVSAFDFHISKNNISELIHENDIVVECSDNIQCKYLVNDYCHLYHIPLVYGSIYKFEGHVSFFRNRSFEDVHLRDAFPEIQEDIPTCSEVGVVNTIAGIIGLLQANEVIKYLAGLGNPLVSELLIYNVLDNEQVKLKLKKNWRNDISNVYEKTNYEPQTCHPDFELDIGFLRKNFEKFQIVSILEDEEHVDIFDDTIHQPYSTIKTDDWVNFTKPVVFYCTAGIRSGHLVSNLRNKNASGKFYSLKNGIKTL
ncbi:MAG: HesA/MoeB/ThiF family protein [Bacteroidia bacterium]|nr:HesA/MoeB/ThiF family protein [Bacteroidia bacterium]